MNAINLALLVTVPQETTSGPDITRYMIICVTLVLAVIFLGWLFQRLVGGALSSRASNRSLRIVDVLPMGGKRKLSVVRCYDRTFVIGVGERELSLVAELDGEDEELIPAPALPAKMGFGEALKRVRRRIQSESKGDKQTKEAGSVRTAASKAVSAQAPKENKQQAAVRSALGRLGKGEGLLG